MIRLSLFLRGLAALCVSALMCAEAWGAGQLVSSGGSTQDKPQRQMERLLRAGGITTSSNSAF